MRSGNYKSSEGTSIGTAITFLFIGLGIGAVTALILAPKSGKHLRHDLRRGYDEARDTIEDWSDEARDRVREVKERVRDVAERSADLAEELRGKVEPLRKAIQRG
jgi:gas vesicle protein